MVDADGLRRWEHICLEFYFNNEGKEIIEWYENEKKNQHVTTPVPQGPHQRVFQEQLGFNLDQPVEARCVNKTRDKQ